MSNTEQSQQNNSLEEIKSDELLLKKNNDSSQIVTLISKIDEVEKLLAKNLFSIPKDQLVKLLKVLTVLSNETNGVVPLNNIINSLNDIFNDGKLEVHEIPLLIKVLNENIMKQNVNNISSADFSFLIKLLIVILVELNVLKLNDTDIKIINALIDTSLELLNIQMHIPSQKELKKCCLC